MYNITKNNYLNIAWAKAKDWTVIDTNNKEYIDFTSAIFTANCGHGVVSEAIKEQVDKVIHCYTFDTPIRSQFISKLKSFLPDFCEKIYLASAGSEVTGWAEKLMRAYKSKLHGGLIVKFQGAFHGKIGIDRDTLVLQYPNEYEDWTDTEYALKQYEGILSGVMFETYQGWSGRFMPVSYVQNVVNFCKRLDIPVCFDEVQSGFYRTGKKFGYEYYGVIPDLLCLGKSLGGGMPLSAVVGRDKYFTFNDMSSTHSGHPVCCAAGLKALEVYENLQQRTLDEKAFLVAVNLQNLCKIYPDLFTSYVSTGLLSALICKSRGIANLITKKAQQDGLLLVNTGKESIKIGPPLIISLDALQTGLNILKSSVEKVSKC